MAYTLIVEAQQIYFYRCRAAFQTHNSIINLCYVPGFAPLPLLDHALFDTFAVIRWTMRALKKATQWEIQLPMGLNADQSSSVSGRIHQWARHEKASNRCQCCHAANAAYAQLFRKPYKSRHNAYTDYIVYIHTHTHIPMCIEPMTTSIVLKSVRGSRLEHFRAKDSRQEAGRGRREVGRWAWEGRRLFELPAKLLLTVACALHCWHNANNINHNNSNSAKQADS